MPEVLRSFGFKFYVYTRDHLPPHVHAVGPDGSAKFLIGDEVELVENAGLKPKDLKLVESIIKEKKDIILEEWTKIHGDK